MRVTRFARQLFFFYYSKPTAHRKEDSSVSSFVAGVKRLRHRVLEHALPFFQCVHGFLLSILCVEVLTLAISGEFLFHLVEERRARAGAAAQFRSIAGRVDVGERLAERHRRHVFLHQCLADRVERLVRAFGILGEVRAHFIGDHTHGIHEDRRLPRWPFETVEEQW